MILDKVLAGTDTEFKEAPIKPMILNEGTTVDWVHGAYITAIPDDEWEKLYVYREWKKLDNGKYRSGKELKEGYYRRLDKFNAIRAAYWDMGYKVEFVDDEHEKVYTEPNHNNNQVVLYIDPKHGHPVYSDPNRRFYKSPQELAAEPEEMKRRTLRNHFVLDNRIDTVPLVAVKGCGQQPGLFVSLVHNGHIIGETMTEDQILDIIWKESAYDAAFVVLVDYEKRLYCTYTRDSLRYSKKQDMEGWIKYSCQPHNGWKPIPEPTKRSLVPMEKKFMDKEFIYNQEAQPEDYAAAFFPGDEYI